jgi:hypothetical protein
MMGEEEETGQDHDDEDRDGHHDQGLTRRPPGLLLRRL